MTSRELEEYRALRATIRERGTARHWIAVAGFAAWAAVATAVGALSAVPEEIFVSLLVLVATFEVIVALHTGVERVGRYLQVFHESESEAACWEEVAMRFGGTYGGGGIDALFSPVFWLATLFNLIPAVFTAPLPTEWTILAVVHALFAGRVWSARRQAAGQRALDLERFSRLKAERPPA